MSTRAHIVAKQISRAPQFEQCNKMVVKLKHATLLGLLELAAGFDNGSI